MTDRIVSRDIYRAKVDACQADSLEGASRPVPRIVDLISRVREQYRRDGAWAAVTKVLRFLARRPDTDVPRGVASGLAGFRSGEEVLHLQPGELIEVKSLPEIVSTLDAEGKLRGLAFLPGMQPFCGKRFHVMKRMETLYQEESGKVRRLKHTVLLADVQCDGLLIRCDRSCYLFWREAWLKRVSETGDPTTLSREPSGKR